LNNSCSWACLSATGVGAVTGVRAEAQTQVTGAMSGVLEKIWFRPAKIVVAVLRGARALGSWKQTGTSSFMTKTHVANQP